jgi:sRNA-binding carbon storage regulator CsrA
VHREEIYERIHREREEGAVREPHGSSDDDRSDGT